MSGPSRVEFTDHGEQKARRLGKALADVAEVVLVGHDQRRRNPGEADWLAVGRRMSVAYNWPDQGDPTCARVVTILPER